MGVFKTLLIILLLLAALATGKMPVRTKRFLLFPRQAPTRHQFIAGIGIPAELDYESLTVGYVLKAMFYLPYNATVFRENPYLPEYANTPLQTARKSTSALRWHLYQYIADLLQSRGYNGQECVLQSICEASHTRFELPSNIFAELLHIFLTPSISQDANTAENNDYYEAERIGRKRVGCDIYACRVSLLSLISTVLIRQT